MSLNFKCITVSIKYSLLHDRLICGAMLHQSEHSKRTCSQQSDRTLNLPTHSNPLIDTPEHMEALFFLFFCKLPPPFAPFESKSSQGRAAHIYLTCCLRLHHLSSINVHFHEAADPASEHTSRVMSI